MVRPPPQRAASGTSLDEARVTYADLVRLLPDLDTIAPGDLLLPILGPLQGVLALYPNQYRLGYQDEQGVYHTRWLSPAALRHAVLAESLDFGWLPSHTLSCGIGANGPWLVQYLPPARHTIQVFWQERDPVTFTLPLPPLVFTGYGTAYFLWAVKQEPASGDSPLFHAPLPNLYDSGGICWGNNHPPPCSAATMADAWRLFLASPFNGHLCANKSRRYPHDARLRLQEIATRQRRATRYPLRDLLPLHVTLQTALRHLVR